MSIAMPNVRDRMTILPSIVPALAPRAVGANIEDTIRSTDALCDATRRPRPGARAARLRALQTGHYAAAIATFSGDFRSRFPESFDGLRALLYVGHPYLKAAVEGGRVN